MILIATWKGGRKEEILIRKQKNIYLILFNDPYSHLKRWPQGRNSH